MDYVAPGFQAGAFNCPHCNAYAQMRWSELLASPQTGTYMMIGMYAAQCLHCDKPSVWRIDTPLQVLQQARQQQGFMYDTSIRSYPTTKLYPLDSRAPLPNPDLPEDCHQDYMEARAIEVQSPRAAAALLRLIIQKLCKHFGEPGKDINTDIGSLVQKGLPKQLQEALDVVRVVGNEAVHPGEVNLDDNPEIVSALFRLVNLIVEKMISEPKQYSDLYQSLPTKKLNGIAQRDKPKQTS